MASRNQRRRKARQQAREQRPAEASHGDRMMAVVVKAAASKQDRKSSTDTWDPDKTIAPPVPPGSLWTVFEQNATHSAAINAKVADAVGRGWQLDAEDDTEDGTDEDVDRVTRELNDWLETVCTQLSFAQLCQQAAREMDAIGWGVWEVVRDQAGNVESDITELLPVPAHSVRAVKGDDSTFAIKRGESKIYFKRFGSPEHVNVESGDRSPDVPEDKRGNELIVFSHYSPRSPFYGIPPWISAMPAIAELTAIREFNVSFFESGGQADRHIHVTSKDDAAAKTLADSIVKQLRDTAGEAHVSIVSHGSDDSKVDVMPLAPKEQGGGRDRAFRGGREDLIKEVLTAHQVPPYRVGLAETGALGGNAAEEMNETYRAGVVEPLQEIIEGELRRTLFGEQGMPTPGYRFAFVDLTPDEHEQKVGEANDLRERGILSPNDAREYVGEDRVEDPAMDRYYIGTQAISTEAGVAEVTALLGELKAALNAAIQTGSESDGEPTEKRSGLRRWRKNH